MSYQSSWLEACGLKLIKMKNVILILFALVLFSSCKEEDLTPPPVISGVEIGSGNSKTVARGKDLHIEAQIVAEGTIREAEVHIHGTGWEHEVDFPELAGKKNGEIHTHIDVPSTATPGHYHVHISVTDQKGQTTEIEADLEITN